MKKYRPYDPDQVYLLPPSPREWLPPNHLAYFVLNLVEELDLGEIEQELQAKDPRGERPFAPTMMTALLLYAYATGVFSSRRIARACVEDVAFRVIAGNAFPHFTTVNAFRLRHLKTLSRLFVQVLKVCQAKGLVKLDHVAIDGTKMKANASKHKAMSFERMEKDESRLRAEVDDWFARAAAADAADDEVEGAYDAAEEIRLREEKLAKMAEAKAALRAEVQAARAATLRAQAAGLRMKAEDPNRAPRKRAEAKTLAKKRDAQASLFDDDNDPPTSADSDLPKNVPPHHPDGTPKPHAQRNFTDPDSRIMVRDGGFLQAFNAQIAVDDAHQIIVAAAVSNQGPDCQYFEPMLRRTVQNCGAAPHAVTADNGFFSSENVRSAERLGVEPFISVGKHRHDGTQSPESPQLHQRTEAKRRMRSLLDTTRGKRIYARRKAVVEPVFGQIRSPRRFNQFSFRGLIKNRCEWLVVCLTHNVLKLWRAAAPSNLMLLPA